MAVGYQYQSDYDKKENKKGFKKKFIILGIGLALLVVVAIIGAPKKANPENPQTTNKVHLSESLQKSRASSDKFVKNTLDGIGSDDMFYSVSNSKHPLNTKRTELNLSGYACEFSRFIDYFDITESIPIFSYKCTSGYQPKFLMIAVINTDNDKIVNWILGDTEDIKAMTLFLFGWKGL